MTSAARPGEARPGTARPAPAWQGKARGDWPASEADLQRAVVELAGYCGWKCLHVRRSLGRKRQWQTTTSIAGWPDLLLWRPGRIVAAELKSDTGRVTPEQDAVLASLEAAGVEVHVWRPADFDAIAASLNTRAAPAPAPLSGP